MFKYYLFQDATETAIDEPIGWDKMESVLKRGSKHGVQVEFSEVQLTFYCGSGGYNILLTEYSANGNDGEMQFKQTFECNGVTEILYQANINFNNLLHVPGEYIEVNLDNVSFGNKLKTRDKTKFAMGATVDLDGNPITPPEPETLNLHSRAIVKQFDALNEETSSGNLLFPDEADSYVNQLYTHVGWISPKLDEIEGLYHYGTSIQESDVVTVNEYLIDIQEAGQYTFDITIYYELQAYNQLIQTIEDLEFKWILRIDSQEFDLTGTIWAPGNVTGSGYDYYSGQITSQIQKTVYLAAGQKVYLFGYLYHKPGFYSGSREFTLTTYVGSNINISALTTTNATTCDVWPVATVLNQLIQAATGFPNRLKSDYFTGCGNQYYLTDGFNIRQFPENTLTLSREETWTGLNPILALGEGLTLDGETELVELEPLEHFYQANEILKIDYPQDYTEEVAGEYIYNSIEIGYEKSNTDEFNALDEFNSKREYQTPIKSFENRLTQLSKFVASMYAVETQRRKPYIEGSRVSGTFDKDTFIFATKWETDVRSIGATGENYVIVNGGPLLNSRELVITSSTGNDGTYTVIEQPVPPGQTSVTILILSPDLPNPTAGDGIATVSSLVAEKDEIFDSTAGVISPDTIYNGRITPLRNLLRWGNVVNSGLWFKSRLNNHIRFVSGEGNTEFQHQFKTGEPCKDGDPDRMLLKENDSPELNWFNRFKKIWKPEYILFKAPVTGDMMQQIRQAHMPQVNATDKHGYISVWDGDEYQQGYLLELRFKDADQTGELSTFKLIKKWDSPLNSTTSNREHSEEFGSDYN